MSAEQIVAIRCTGAETRTLDQLTPFQGDLKRLSPENAAKLRKEIIELGFSEPVSVWQENGTSHILNGHQRVVVLKMMEADGWTVPPLPCSLVEADSLEQAKRKVLALTSQYGEITEDGLSGFLEDLDITLDEVDGSFRFPEINLEALRPDPEPIEDDPPPLLDDAVTEQGELIELGRHRVLCDDCTDQNASDRLMDGEQAALGITSPPYAVGKEYEEGVTFAEHLALIEGMADMGLRTIAPGGFFFVNFGEIASQAHASKLTGCTRQCLYLMSADYWRIFRERAYELYAQRVWYKPFNRLQQPFWTYHTSIPHYQEWEHIWTWRLPGGEGDACHDWDISSRAVWDTRSEDTSDKPLTRHVSAFPTCLPARAMKAHTAREALVWEPFLGSGTTLVVAEQVSRTCYGMEIEPRYCDVIVRRYYNLVGWDKAPADHRERWEVAPDETE